MFTTAMLAIIAALAVGGCADLLDEPLPSYGEASLDQPQVHRAPPERRPPEAAPAEAAPVETARAERSASEHGQDASERAQSERSPSDDTGAWVNNLDANGWVAPALSVDGKTATLRRPPEHRPDGLVVMWERFEHRDREPGQWRSLVAMSEFDCQEGRARTLQETTYSEPNLSGRAVTASMPGDWTYPIPGSMMEGSMRLACQPAEPARSRAARSAGATRAKAAAEAAVPAADKPAKATKPTAKKAKAQATKAQPGATKTSTAKKSMTIKPKKAKAPAPEPTTKHIDIPLPPDAATPPL